MSWSYDPGTDVGRVRLLIPDRNESSPIFSDEEIEAFLDLEASNVKLGTAAALGAIASDEVLVQKRIKLLDLTTDGPAESVALLARAAELRRQVEAGSEADGAEFVTAEVAHGIFAQRDTYRNRQARNA